MKLFIFMLILTSSMMCFAEETNTDCMAMNEGREKNVKAQQLKETRPVVKTVSNQ